LTNDPIVVIVGFILQGAFGQSMSWLLAVYTAERFPTEVRAAASGFCLHVGSLVGGVTPLVIAVLATYNDMGLAVAMLLGTSVGAASFCMALLAGPETRGTEFVAEPLVA